MKQVLSILAATIFMITIPALSTAGDRSRGDSGFLQHRSGTVFERAGYDQRHAERKQFVKERRHAEKRAWKEERRHARYERGNRHRHGPPRHWRHDRYRHAEPRVIYRYAPPRRTVVRERVVVSPVFPVPLPPSLVLHFTF